MRSDQINTFSARLVNNLAPTWRVLSQNICLFQLIGAAWPEFLQQCFALIAGLMPLAPCLFWCSWQSMEWRSIFSFDFLQSQTKLVICHLLQSMIYCCSNRNGEFYIPVRLGQVFCFWAAFSSNATILRF